MAWKCNPHGRFLLFVALSARLYSGSLSPGGGPYKYTAPVAPSAASSLVAAFNGGFQMKDAHGRPWWPGRPVERRPADQHLPRPGDVL